MSASLNAYATKEMVDAATREIRDPSGTNDRLRFSGGNILLHDRATGRYRPVEADNGAPVIVQEEN